MGADGPENRLIDKWFYVITTELLPQNPKILYQAAKATEAEDIRRAEGGRGSRGIVGQGQGSVSAGGGGTGGDPSGAGSSRRLRDARAAATAPGGGGYLDAAGDVFVFFICVGASV